MVSRKQKMSATLPLFDSGVIELDKTEVVYRASATSQKEVASPTLIGKVSKSSDVCAALPAFVESDACATRELLSLRMRLLSALPTPFAVTCRDASNRYAIVFTTSRAAYTAARTQRVAVFVGGEFSALALSAEHDRMSLRAWVDRKLSDPTWRLSAGDVLAGIGEPLSSLGWKFGEVLRAFGLKIEHVQLEVVSGTLERVG